MFSTSRVGDRVSKYCSCQSEIPCLSQIVWKKTWQRWSRMRSREFCFLPRLPAARWAGVSGERQRKRQHVSEWECVCSFLCLEMYRKTRVYVLDGRGEMEGLVQVCSIGRRDPHMLRLIHSIPFCTRGSEGWREREIEAELQTHRRHKAAQYTPTFL